MDNPMPDIPEPICAIFRKWSDIAAELAEAMPDYVDVKPRIQQAAETMGALGAFGAKNLTVLQKPRVTYGKVEFMSNFMETVNKVTPILTLPAEIKQVRDWLVQNR